MAKGARSIEREQFWRRVMKKFAASRLNIREFCAAESLSEPSFYAWRRELRLRDGEATQPASVNHPSAKRAKQPRRRTKETSVATPVASPATLVEVVPQPVAASSIEIETPAGYTIRLHGPTDQKALSAVFGCLPGAASC